MGTVKYTGPVASFHCPTEATIRSLKVHFSPKQEGSGDPSPENVREIMGWDGVEAYQTGKNIWDEEWELGYLNTSTGVNAATSSQIRAKNYIKLLPNTTYYVKYGYSVGGIWAIFFDQNKKVISDYAFSTSRSVNAFGVNNRNFTTPSNCYFMRFYCTAAYGTIYRNDIAICIASATTSYEPYHGSTTNYEFGVLGKNKLDPIWESGNININTGLAQAGSNSIRLKDKIKIFPNTTYTISWSSTGRNIYRFAYKKDGTFSRYLGLQGVSGQTVKFNTDEYYLWIYQYNNTNEPENIQVELGSTSTAYEPYDPNKTVYGGWVDLITGEAAKTWTVRPISQMTVVKTNGSGVWQHRFDIRAPWVSGVGYEDAGGAYQAICSIFSLGKAETNFTYRTYAGLIDVYDDTTETAEDFQTKYGDYTVAYNIRSELYEYYQLAPTQLQTFLGQNNVWSNADYVEVEYDLHETQNILARKQFIMANQPHIVKPAAAPLQNFVTNMAAPVKSCKVYFNPIQEGTGDPSPENVRPISGWTGVDVYRGYEYLSNVQIATGKTLNASGLEATESGMAVTDYIPVEVGHTYTLKFTSTTAGRTRRIFGYSASKEPTSQLASVSWATVGNTFSMNAEIPSDTSYIRACYYNGDIGKTLTEPSAVTTLPLDWTDSAGTVYGGYVDLVSGEVVREAIKVTTNEIVSFHDITDRGNGVYEICLNLPIYARSERRTEAKCSCFVYGSTSTGVADRFDLTYILNQKARQVRISHYFEEAPTIEVYKEYLQSIGFEVVYYIDQESYFITPTALKTLRGTNNIWASNGGDNIEIAYWKH